MANIRVIATFGPTLRAKLLVIILRSLSLRKLLKQLGHQPPKRKGLRKELTAVFCFIFKAKRAY